MKELLNLKASFTTATKGLFSRLNRLNEDLQKKQEQGQKTAQLQLNQVANTVWIYIYI